jgi:hypothetical protein
MVDDHDTTDQDPWAGAEDPRTIAAIGAELERISGTQGLPKIDPFGGHMILPLRSIDEVLQMLREMPSNIGVEGFAARLRDRFGDLPALKPLYPKHPPGDGA